MYLYFDQIMAIRERYMATLNLYYICNVKNRNRKRGFVLYMQCSVHNIGILNEMHCKHIFDVNGCDYLNLIKGRLITSSLLNVYPN